MQGKTVLRFKRKTPLIKRTINEPMELLNSHMTNPQLVFSSAAAAAAAAIRLSSVTVLGRMRKRAEKPPPFILVGAHSDPSLGNKA